ncbi:MAG: TetR/AcrR family transcriptional regulator [Polyangiaceae bacterium]|jgi:AcrR family transcriptional regulator|nr:TetR/AcrR family transcriptional regulator [Polyangiaceae bacterium]
MAAVTSRPVKRTPRRDAGRPRGAFIEDAVLARALEELAEHGVDNLSVERIARAAEVNKTSIYRRWPTRAELVTAALERAHGEVIVKLVDTGSLRGDLTLLAESVAALLEQPQGRALARAALADAGAPEVVALATQRLERQARQPLHALIERARARGEWRTHVTPGVLLAAVVGGLLHRVMVERRPASGAWLAELVDLVVGGTATPAAAPRCGSSR